MVVPIRREHANYNSLPSRNNIFRARDNWVVPCAKCKYAKSYFMESAVPECPSGYHKMYTAATCSEATRATAATTTGSASTRTWPTTVSCTCHCHKRIGTG